MMANGLQKMSNLAYYAKGIAKVIRAFLVGGWYGAAIEAVKQFWPQILAISLALILIPIIIFYSIPLVMMGWETSSDTEISQMTESISNLSVYYDNYENYYTEYVNTLKASVFEPQQPDNPNNTDIPVPMPLSITPNIHPIYEVRLNNQIIQKNWFMALHSVSVFNNPQAVTEGSIKEFVIKTVTHSLVDIDVMPEITGPVMPLNVNVMGKMLLIDFLSPEGIMSALGFSEFQCLWATHIHDTLEAGGY